MHCECLIIIIIATLLLVFPLIITFSFKHQLQYCQCYKLCFEVSMQWAIQCKDITINCVHWVTDNKKVFCCAFFVPGDVNRTGGWSYRGLTREVNNDSHYTNCKASYFTHLVVLTTIVPSHDLVCI